MQLCHLFLHLTSNSRFSTIFYDYYLCDLQSAEPIALNQTFISPHLFITKFLFYTFSNTFYSSLNLYVFHPLFAHSPHLTKSSNSNTYIKHMEKVKQRFFRIVAPRLGLSDPFVVVCGDIALQLWILSLKTSRWFNNMKFSFKLTNGFLDCFALLGYST